MTTNNRIPNRLADEKSPYLLQHAHNPVDWYPWRDEAFKKAIAEDKPVFLSIGYSACHWCHVMERECFENKYIAQLLNDGFVSIKVDREEMPDVDHFYMSACTAMTGSGGWPLTLFLTTDRLPFFAGTYFPEENFMNLLNSVDYQWKNNRSQLSDVAEEISKTVGQKKETSEEAFDENAIHRAFARLGSTFDKQYGGFGGAPKFPSVQNLLFFLRYSLFTGNAKGMEMTEKTLDAMANGGIFDAIGGGFCRYSTDRKWLVPHFEKMMIDNALLAMVYLEAGAAIEPHFSDVARRILTYSLREMRGDSGFYTAQDADSEGEEGKYYLFTPAEVESVLGSEDGEQFCKLYDITKNGNFEGKNIPNRIGKTDELDLTFAERCFEKLYSFRAKRIAPFKDDKCLASVNGLMVAALSTAARLLHEDRYAAEAEKTARFILDELMPEGRLRTGYREGPMAAKATLDDYTYVLWGFYELYQATLKEEWLRETTALADKLIALFYEDGALYLSGSDATGLPARTRSDYDGAYPSGSGVAVNLLYRLGVLTENEAYLKTAEKVMMGLSKEAAAYPTAFISLLCADLTRKHGGTLLTLTTGEGFAEMKHAAEIYNPFLDVRVSKDMPAQNGKATAYLCTGKVCLPPETDAARVLGKISLK